MRRCINKEILLREISKCPSQDISLNRFQYWLATFGYNTLLEDEDNNQDSVTNNDNTTCEDDVNETKNDID